jgi:hypothetical protein
LLFGDFNPHRRIFSLPPWLFLYGHLGAVVSMANTLWRPECELAKHQLAIVLRDHPDAFEEARFGRPTSRGFSMHVVASYEGYLQTINALFDAGLEPCLEQARDCQEWDVTVRVPQDWHPPHGVHPK